MSLFWSMVQVLSTISVLAYSELQQESLFLHAGCLPHLSDYTHDRMDLLFDGDVSEAQLAFLDPFASQGSLPWDPAKQVPN